MSNGAVFLHVTSNVSETSGNTLANHCSSCFAQANRYRTGKLIIVGTMSTVFNPAKLSAFSSV